jgi:hypothetical protein
MDEDRSLFGDGPYPVTGPLAILARVAFLGAVAAIVIAVFLPERYVPDFVRSTHLQHFAAFYVAALLGLAAMARTSITTVALRFFVFASLLELAHFFAGAPWRPLFDNWASDVGGLAAAVAPILVARFRRRVALKRES